jgi:hypothetical protein
MARFECKTQLQVFVRTIFAAVAINGFVIGAADAQVQKIRIAYSSRSNTVTPLYVAADVILGLKRVWQ